VIVAIDGPAGAGKSTVARELAARLGVGYLNTGAMYRALSLLALERSVPPDDAGALVGLARAHEIALQVTPIGERVMVDGRDVTDAVRAQPVTRIVSQVAAHRAVRGEIVSLQREVLATGDWVADGRDIGSVVCPDAEVKIYLTADPRERAHRRHDELVGGGADVALEDVLQDIVERDRIDSTRTESPLVVPDGAVVVDTSGVPAGAVVERLLEIVAAPR
jgi:cytidylate kinase